jgi:hypothetical protein
MPRPHLISQVSFLYRSSWRIEKGTELWFVSNKDRRCRGFQLYMRNDCEEDSPLRKLYDQLETRFDFIHDDYLLLFQADFVQWAAWLTTSFSISFLPRLASVSPGQKQSSSNASSTSALSQEFQFLFQNCHSRDILQVLRDNWYYYSKWLLDDNTHWDPKSSADKVGKALRKTLRTALKSTPVSTKGQKGKTILSKTVLSTIDLFLSSNALIPNLDIEDSQDPRW